MMADVDAPAAAIPCERHFTAQQIAEHFGVSADLVIAEQDRGKLAYLRFGGRRVVPESAILAYVAANAVGDHPQRHSPAPAAATRRHS